jgi:hypothetical protein
MKDKYGTQRDVIDAFFEFFEFTYECTLTKMHKQRIEAEILSGWGDSDESDHRLVGYIIHLHQVIGGQPTKAQPGLRKQAKNLLAVELSRPAGNDATRILSAVHFIVEELRPGCSGVKPIRPAIKRPAGVAKTTAATAAVTAAMTRPGPTPSPQARAGERTNATALDPTAPLVPNPPLTLTQLQAMIHADPNALVQLQNLAGGANAAVANPYVAPASLGPSLPGYTPPAQPSQYQSNFQPDPGFPDPRDPRAIQRWEEDEEHKRQMVNIRSNWFKAQSEVSRNIIKNIG